MKSNISQISIGVIVPSTACSEMVARQSTQTRPASTYATLLENPVASLVSNVADRPDVQSVAILGYN
ncbi:conserved protein of unknown function (plasmid) [Caballeronia sp. S22]